MSGREKKESYCSVRRDLNPSPQFLFRFTRLLSFGLLLFLSSSVSGETFKLGAHEVEPLKVLEFETPLSAHAKINAGRTRNPRVETAKGAIVVPADFNPTNTWPVLVISATSDGSASSIRAMKSFVKTAVEEGWVVIAADGPNGKPQDDGDAWRLAMLIGVLDFVHKEWPASRKWPIACGGFSGGAKRSGLIAALMMKAGYKVVGIFMGGCNQDTATPGFLLYQPGPGFKRIPIFLSSGASDTIATPEHNALVKQSLERGGFLSVRLESYSGGHQLNPEHLKAGLNWFRPPAAKTGK